MCPNKCRQKPLTQLSHHIFVPPHAQVRPHKRLQRQEGKRRDPARSRPTPPPPQQGSPRSTGNKRSCTATRKSWSARPRLQHGGRTQPLHSGGKLPRRPLKQPRTHHIRQRIPLQAFCTPAHESDCAETAGAPPGHMRRHTQEHHGQTSKRQAQAPSREASKEMGWSMSTAECTPFLERTERCAGRAGHTSHTARPHEKGRPQFRNASTNTPNADQLRRRSTQRDRVPRPCPHRG